MLGEICIAAAKLCSSPLGAVTAAGDGVIGHFVERMQQAGRRIVAGVDFAVKTLYSPHPVIGKPLAGV
jgi:hypothetical protein